MATNNIKADFPLLKSGVTYLDSGATTQKPQSVLSAVEQYYETSNANVHRGIYKLAEISTQEYEAARHTIAKFLSAKDEEIIFTSGATHSLNLAAHILAATVGPEDEILTTVAEHHSCFVPFQQLALRSGARLVVVPLSDETITEESINERISAKTKIIAIAQTSNVLGYTLDLSKIKKKHAVLVIDAAQSIVHSQIELGEADFIAFSGHKAYAPMGIGILAAKKKLIEKAEPFFYGGSMIEKVTIEKSTWAQIPSRFEAGTPNVAGAVGLATALTYYKNKRKEIQKQEEELTKKATALIAQYARIIGPKKRTASIISFVMDHAHAHDVAQVLDSVGVCVRAGRHCCDPLHDALHLEATVRVSIGAYNTDEDLLKLEAGLKKARAMFS